jgi:hypothetical protein
MSASDPLMCHTGSDQENANVSDFLLSQTDNGQDSASAHIPNNLYFIPQNYRDMLVFSSLVFALEIEAKIVQLLLYYHPVPYTETSRSHYIYLCIYYIEWMRSFFIGHNSIWVVNVDHMHN